MRSSGSGTAEILPRLEAFDAEFNLEHEVFLLPQRGAGARLLAVIGVLLGVAVVSALALAWQNGDERLRSLIRSVPLSEQTGSDEKPEQQIDRLTREVAALKDEIKQLTEAQSQPVERGASSSTGEDEGADHAASHWYSDPVVLSYGIAGQPGSAAVSAPPRRQGTARQETRNTRKRESASPLSLEAPQ
jgi:hypothetical protein